MDGTGLAACARLGAAEDAELIGGATRRSFPLVEESFGRDVVDVSEWHPLPHCAVLDEVVMDRNDVVLRRQPDNQNLQPAVHQQLSGHVRRRSWLRAYIIPFTTDLLTPSTPAVPSCCCSKGSAPYWSNPPFFNF